MCEQLSSRVKTHNSRLSKLESLTESNGTLASQLEKLASLLKQLNMVLGIQRHDRLLPTLRIAKSHLGTARLSPPILRAYFFYLHIKQLFNGAMYICFGGQATDLKGVSIAARRAVNSLFRQQGLDNHLVRLKLDARLLWYVPRHDDSGFTCPLHENMFGLTMHAL